MTNKIIEIAENLTILNNESLYDFYTKKYQEHYNIYHHKWDEDGLDKIIKVFENRCIQNFKKFQFLSIISFDVFAFSLIFKKSGVLENDEELCEYFRVLNNIDKEFCDNISKIDHMKSDIFDELNLLKDDIIKLNAFYNDFDKMYVDRINFSFDHAMRG